MNFRCLFFIAHHPELFIRGITDRQLLIGLSKQKKYFYLNVLVYGTGMHLVYLAKDVSFIVCSIGNLDFLIRIPLRMCINLP